MGIMQASKNRFQTWLVLWGVFSIIFVLVDIIKWHAKGHVPPMGMAAASICHDIINAAFGAWLFPLGAATWLVVFLSLLVTSLSGFIFLFELEKRISMSPAIDTAVTEAVLLLQDVIIAATVLWWIKHRENQPLT